MAKTSGADRTQWCRPDGDSCRCGGDLYERRVFNRDGDELIVTRCASTGARIGRRDVPPGTQREFSEYDATGVW